ncbi:MAG: hypothetical protein IJY73_08300 [Oscillospiraceae bacterium]|nr:hypothetical protein [Oscillospiraceae bacterium]
MVFNRKKTQECFDIEVPLNITANELIYGLNVGLKLGLDLRDAENCYLCTENPIALLKGNKSLENFGLHDGTKIFFNK